MPLPRLLVLFACLLAVPALPAAAKDFPVQYRQNVLVFGDSITAPGTYGQIMQDMIDAKYPERQIKVMSRGVSGDTVQGSTKRLDIDCTMWRPDWVCINLGINDNGRFTVEEYLNNYEYMINRILHDTRAQIVVVPPLYVENDLSHENEAAMVAGLKAVSTKYGLIYAPLYDEMNQWRKSLPKGVVYTGDGIHPNLIGYYMMAESILHAMNFPLPSAPINLDYAAWHAEHDYKSDLVGTKFTMPLYTPVNVTLTAPAPRQMVALSAKKPVVLDGKLAEWDRTQGQEVGSPETRVEGVVSWAREHNRGRCYAAYDDTALYLAFDIDDTDVRNSPDKSLGLIDRDMLEIFVDARPSADRAANPHVGLSPSVLYIAQYLVAPATPDNPTATVQVGGGNKDMAIGVTCASLLNGHGYTVEIRIPADRFPPGALAQGGKIGFDWGYIDNDRVDRYVAANAWRWSGSIYSFFNTVDYGTLTFGS